MQAINIAGVPQKQALMLHRAADLSGWHLSRYSSPFPADASVGTSKGLGKVKGKRHVSEKFCKVVRDKSGKERMGEMGADRFTVITVVDHTLSRHIPMLSEKKGDSMAKNLWYSFVILEVTHFKVEDKFEHKNLLTWKRQPRRNEILLVATSPIYSQMLWEGAFFFFFFSFPGLP